ncbi:MAG: hypothetical protein GY911_06765, partial [Actinomycetales bacterium]|nr:hypothetical protein [Actinomycetales bacterium]
MTAETTSFDPSRRAFLVGTCGVAALAAGGFGTALLADDAWAAKGIKRRKNGKVVVRVDKVAALKSDLSRVVLVPVSGTLVAVLRSVYSYTALNR